MDASIWQGMGGLAAVMAAVCTLLLWVIRRVVREEFQRFWDKKIESIQNDVEVLRVAVFNHLSHGEKLPSEERIREILGYGPRSMRDRYARSR